MNKQILVIAALVATAARDIRMTYDETGTIPDPVKEVYYHAGDRFQISGSSANPTVACMHGGSCVAVKDLRIPSSCKKVGRSSKYGPDWEWEGR